MVNRGFVTQPRQVLALLVAVVFSPISSTVFGQDCAPTWASDIGNPGMSQSVQSTIVFDDGVAGGPMLYAGGAFVSAGSTDADRIARWNGQSWLEVGEGFDAQVLDMIVFDDGGNGASLYAAGEFTLSGTTQVNRVARWNGSMWTPIGAGLDNNVFTLAAFDDGNGERLYAGGNFTSDGDGSLARRIGVWNGTRWLEVAGGVLGSTSSVQALAVFDDGNGPALYIGGNFGFVGGNNPFNNIVRWDGENLTALGEGVSGGSGGNVFAMEIFDDGSGPALYVGGLFTSAGGQPIAKLARWDGQIWSEVGGGITGGLLGVQDIVADHEAGKLYVTGLISAAGGTAVNNIAVWDGESWSALGSGLTGGAFPAGMTMTLGDIGYGQSLFVGGLFTVAGGASAERIAEWSMAEAPVIDEQPQGTDAEFGQSVDFSVIASNAETYQWRFNGDELIDGNGVSGATTAVLELQSVSLDDAGMYDVIVGNECGEIVSDAAELTINPKPGDLNGDGVVDGADLLMLLSAWGTCGDPENCPADLNGDGVVDGSDLLQLLANWG